jgi:UDP-N-acetylglucosamine 2-epimerase
LNLIRHAAAVVGNSSSGIVEAPALKVATVNIGPRQDGRLRANSIIDCTEDNQAIVQAICEALSPRFRALLPSTPSVYGISGFSDRMFNWLLDTPLPKNLNKEFHDL